MDSAHSRVATPNPAAPTATEIWIVIRARMRTDFNKVSETFLASPQRASTHLARLDDVLNGDDEVT